MLNFNSLASKGAFVINGLAAFAAFTVTLQVYFFLFTVAVIIAVPAFFAVTLPVLLTAAMAFLLELQVTFCLVPVIFNVNDSPVSRVISFLLYLITAASATAILFTGNTEGVTRVNTTISTKSLQKFLN